MWVKDTDRMREEFKKKESYASIDCVGIGVDTKGATRYSCYGKAPRNTTFCSGDTSLLSSKEKRISVTECSESRKCEYKCNDQYILKNEECVCSRRAASSGPMSQGALE